jgi:hypothetical protein
VTGNAIAERPAVVQLDVAADGSQVEPFLDQEVFDKEYPLEIGV